jgi:hypothetical protein
VPTRVVPRNAVSAEFLRLAPDVEKYLQPFVVPASFLAIAFVVSWASIRGREPGVIGISVESLKSRPPSRRRSRDAFLYFDGTYGFLSQTLLALAVAVNIGFAARADVLLRYDSGIGGGAGAFELNTPFVVAAVGALIIFWGAALFSGYLTYYKFPKLLFKINGYYDVDGGPESRPPWGKYILSAIFLAPLAVLGVSLLYMAAVWIVTALVAGAIVVLRPGEPVTLPPPPGS